MGCLYIGIGDANLLIQNATNSISTSDAIKKTALGEGYFMRAYCYLRLVSQFGAVPLKLSPSTTVELEFTRQDPKDIYDQIVRIYNRHLICYQLQEALIVLQKMLLHISSQKHIYLGQVN
jgi:hypothetical protein